MAVERYFEKFPSISYSNNQAIDITKRVTLLDRVSSNPYVFYPYEITSDERADQLAYRYYKDPYRSWIFYITNKIVDPYYDWYLSNDEFSEFVVKKYGSTVSANQKVKYYRNNWANSTEQTITNSEYNALTVSQKEYWEAVYDNRNQIRNYTRKQRDYNHGTNKIVKYVVSAAEFQLQSLVSDEIVNINFDSMTSGNGQFLKADLSSNSIYVQHMRGSFDETVTANSYLYSTESNINVAFTSVTVLADNIPAEEEMYWEAVTYFDYENEKNEYNKTIRIMDSDLKDVAAENLRDLLKENF